MQAAFQTGNVPKCQNKVDDTKLHRKVIESLDKFFNATPYTVEWAKSRSGKTGVHITYTDFFSERLTSQMLRDIIPDSIQMSLKRVYSDTAVSRILLNEYKKNRVAVVDCYEGRLDPETIRDFVTRKLDSVEML